MRVLVTWGSKQGGTEGIARMLGANLVSEGLEGALLPAQQGMHARGFGAVIVGGALYANRWHRDARRFVRHRERDLRKVPVWFFSSGPLDDSAAQQVIAPPTGVQVLMERVGAQGHVTFGGRLAPDARGFPASAMAKEHAGDWRDPEHIRRWAGELARALPAAQPRPVVAQPGHSVAALLAHAVAGWAACAVVMGALLQLTSLSVAVAVHAAAAPVIFTLLARHYFAERGAREPLPTALAFVAVVALLDVGVVAGTIQRSLAMFGSFAGTWLPLVLIFLATWATGALMSTLPWPKPEKPPTAGASPHAHGPNRL